MSALESLLADVRAQGGLTLSWRVIKNMYFPGEDRAARLRAWCEDNQVLPSFDYLEQNAQYSVIQSVYLRDQRPARP